MVVTDTLYSVFTNKCTRCHEGEIFTEKNPYQLRKMFSMHQHCEHCNLKYEREPSFFTGAMYVSYGLTSGWFIICFVLQTYLLQWNIYLFLGVFLTFIIAIAPLNLRWSRIFWLSFFFPFDKTLQVAKK
ncbi:MAG: DUF983 domain-containing protein [Bacteroidota bacterium]